MHKGFVFIELLWVFILITAVGSVAIVNYQSYITRAQISEGLILAVEVRQAVTDYYAYHGRFPVNNQMANLLEPTALQGRYVAEIAVIAGDVRIRFKESLPVKQITFHPQVNPLGVMLWQCNSQYQSVPQPEKYFPSACR